MFLKGAKCYLYALQRDHFGYSLHHYLKWCDSSVLATCHAPMSLMMEPSDAGLFCLQLFLFPQLDVEILNCFWKEMKTVSIFSCCLPKVFCKLGNLIGKLMMLYAALFFSNCTAPMATCHRCRGAHTVEIIFIIFIISRLFLRDGSPLTFVFQG